MGMVGRRFVWAATVAVVAGVGSGLLMAGPGGRLAMRLLAATAGDAAQGRLTEAEEVVGRITTDGTIGFIVFTSLSAGAALGALYMVVRRWLPKGRWSGLTFGMLLLLVVATRLDPLRGDNPDFDIVGPGWVAVLVFGALVVVHGMLVAALAAGYGRLLPLPSANLRSLWPYLLLVPTLIFPLPVLVLVPVGLLVACASQVPALVGAVQSRRGTVAGRAALGIAAAACLPGFVSTVTDLAGRTP